MKNGTAQEVMSLESLRNEHKKMNAKIEISQKQQKQQDNKSERDIKKDDLEQHAIALRKGTGINQDPDVKGVSQSPIIQEGIKQQKKDNNKNNNHNHGMGL